MKQCILVFIHLCLLISGQAQRSLLGKPVFNEEQYIIQITNKKDINSVLDKLNFGHRNTLPITPIRQIMNEPLNIWLVQATEKNEGNLYALKANKDVINIHPNRPITPRLVPNDPLFKNQWQFNNLQTEGNDMDILRAWDVTTGGLTPSGDTIVICVIDDGVNGNHEDLKGNIWINHLEIPNNGIDDDENGYIDDYRGWNIKTDDDDVYSGGGHGTPVCGIVGAKGDNNVGVSGVNWNVKIMMVNYGSSTEANALSAYAYAYKMRKLYNDSKGEKGAFIVATNASWGIDKAKAEEAPLWCALYDSLGNVGILNCGATANSNVNVDVQGDLPTSCTSEYLISVTNLSRSDTKVGAAGYGRKSIDIGAYGQNTYTLTQNAYGNFGGTSGATPHVTGMVGLLYSIPCPIFDSLSHVNPSAAALIAKDMILNGASALPSLKGITTTGGKLNAFRASSNLQTLCESCSQPSGISFIPYDEMMTVSWVSGSEPNVTLRYRRTDEVNWEIIQNFTNGDTIANLNHCTEYEVQLRSECGFLPDSFSYSKFVQTGGCCTKPTLGVNYGTENTIHINWSSSIPANYILQYKESDGNWIDTLLQENHFVLNDLPECTAYQFRIRSACIQFGDFSTYTPINDISTSCGSCTEIPYCGFGDKDATDEWIESLTIGNQYFFSGPSERGYRNFAGLANFELQVGETYPFKIKAGYSSTSFTDFYKILIDFNQDGFWSEDELLFETPVGERDSVIGYLVIPAEAKEGYSKMRVIISYEQFYGGCDNNDFEYGEVEDYCVFITSKDCANGTKATITAVQNNTLKFEISYSNSENDNVKLSYRPFGTSDWQSIIGKDSIIITGLDSCTLYEYQYYGICGTRLSEASRIDTVSTSCLNQVIDIKNSVTIHPNPSSNLITISSNYIPLTSARVMIKEMAGRRLYDGILESQYNTIEISHFVSGIYLLEIMDKNGQKWVFKLTKI